MAQANGSEVKTLEQNASALEKGSQTLQRAYSYEGERNDRGERHGKGKATLPNGDTYEGEYRNGMRHGLGQYSFHGQNGARYVGEYESNRKCGYGTFYYPDASRYEGYWKEDKRQGHGIYYYANKDVYDGEWQNDQRHGRGTYKYDTDNMTYKGMWRNGKRSGEGQLLFGENYYEGHFREDKMLGPGRYVFKNGSEQHGEYVIEKQDGKSAEAATQDGKENNTQEFVTKWRCRKKVPASVIKSQ